MSIEFLFHHRGCMSKSVLPAFFLVYYNLWCYGHNSGLRRLATVLCMGATLTAVKEGTKVVRPRSDQMSKCTDKDWSGDWDWALISTMKTIPLCMIRVLRNLTLALYEGLALQDYNNKAPDDKGCNSTMLGYRSMCVGIAVLAHKACVVR